ncbi:hypothetical protein [Azohydromonas aeria]|uniref:hypothetical protein n=1 Tax=Azohydromonas aeria TaxID=2590212 RepID=UPI0012FBA286|nr:hypothetical protein [Azohydromonas aeria]
MDTQAWGEGFRAGQRLRGHEPPYDSDTWEAWSWHRGFIEGAAQRLGRRYSDQPAAPVEWPSLPRHAQRHGAPAGPHPIPAASS